MKGRTSANTKRPSVVALNARIRSCRLCHAAGFLDEALSIPIARDPEPDAPVPRILLIGQAPSLRGQAEDRPFAGTAGEKLRGWFELGGIARDDFYRKINFSAITRCYPGRLPGARGDRVPAPAEQALCRPWLDELFGIIQPKVVILIGLLAIRTYLGRVPSLTNVIGSAVIRDDVRYLPLPHPSGVSRWLNEPENQAAVVRAMGHLRGWVDELDL
ncbi:uracil-DNA glycosylase family protein [Singulisphaera sp. PoT]|uniref:uracil-DNA glycosylase family protein n=1 Tax=Singulisphaera sp. PoT TaxID=3411797 RepID=UPI003BF53D8A